MEIYQNTSEEFSLSEGGPFNRMLVKLNLQNSPMKIAVFSLCLTWLPLVIITAIEGTLYSGIQLPFIRDFAMQGRVLLGIPMLIIIKFAIDSKVIVVLKYLSDALMDPQERNFILSTTLRRARKLTNSAIAEISLLLIVIVATVSFVKGGVFSGLGGGTSWMTTTNAEGNQSLSVSGYWAVIISIPVFQFLLLRWLWRYFVWSLLIFRLSKAKLNLLPTHADRAGGLGVMILVQRSFNLIFVTGSVVLSGQFVAQLLEHPDSFNLIRGEAIAYIVICIVLILLPLFFFLGRLLQIKNDGLLHLSNLGAELSRKFEKEWVNALPIEKRIEEQQVDPSMVYDYSGVYESLQQLRTIPVTLRDIIGMALTLFVPFIPILFIHYSVAELLQRIVGLLA